MAAMEEIPRYEINEKTKKGQKATANWGKPKKNTRLNQLQVLLPAEFHSVQFSN